MHAGQMTRGITTGIGELTGIGFAQRTLAVEMKLARIRIVCERIEIAAERLGFTESAALVTEMAAARFDADGLHRATL